jgi:hypothetical protein
MYILGISLGRPSGGAAILDLHSGAVSYGDKFVNVYTLDNSQKFITTADLTIYKVVKNKIQHAIAENFGIDSDSLYLTHPTFFSKLSNLEPKTPHDEYWNIHVDKVKKQKRRTHTLYVIRKTTQMGIF